MKAQLALIASALLLVSNIASAQQQQAPSDTTGQGMPGMMGYGMPGYGMPGYGMPGYGMPGYGMPGYGMPGMMGQGMPGMMGYAVHMRIMMILMDTDGDGALSLEEVQAAHAKIFKAIDADKDGKVTLTEIQMFFRGGSSTANQ